jgi:ribosomal protein S30
MGKVHGSLARAGKVKGQTPKVEAAEDKKKQPRGRAKKRLQYVRNGFSGDECRVFDARSCLPLVLFYFIRIVVTSMLSLEWEARK